MNRRLRKMFHIIGVASETPELGAEPGVFAFDVDRIEFLAPRL
jgi:hypothetical protein